MRRLQILKHDYADPLRNFSRSKDTAIIPAYEAKTLFGNIDNLLPVNEAFLTDLEKMAAPNGLKAVGGVGDVALRHFKELRGFEQYKQYYVKREDAQVIFEREVSKRSSRFASYIDVSCFPSETMKSSNLSSKQHIKYQSTDSRNRIGLRELLMEPVQRIPRYTLLFRTMLKHMSPDDPQRAKIIEADEIASKIAQAETDEQTKRAAIFYCLIATIDGFPPELFSNSRRYIDCIDVEDILTDAPMSSAASSSSISATSLHCTLFLFDDKLVIVKRPGNGERGGKALSGLDGVDKVTKAGGIPTGKKKSGMTCKGVVDIADVVVTDVGGAGQFIKHIFRPSLTLFQKLISSWRTHHKTKLTGGLAGLSVHCPSSCLPLQSILTLHRRRPKNHGSWITFGRLKRPTELVRGNRLYFALMNKRLSVDLEGLLLPRHISTCTKGRLSCRKPKRFGSVTHHCYFWILTVNSRVKLLFISIETGMRQQTPYLLDWVDLRSSSYACN